MIKAKVGFIVYGVHKDGLQDPMGTPLIDDKLVANAKKALVDGGLELVEYDLVIASKAEAKECLTKFKKADDVDAIVLFSGTWVWASHMIAAIRDFATTGKGIVLWTNPGSQGWRPVGGLFIDTGIDVALSHQGFAMGPPLPPWNIFFQLGYVFSAKARTKIKTVIKTKTVEVPKIIRPPATEGRIRGVVKDTKTNVPVAAAIITFPGLGLTDLATAEDGSYTTYKLKAGKVKLEVRAKGYVPWSGVAIVLVSKTVTLNVPLVPAAPKTGIVLGTVTDKAGTPLAASVMVEGTEKKKVSADSTGAFTMKLKPGAYKIKASMDGYFNKYNAFVVNAGTKQSLSFKLTKRPARPIVIIQKTRLRIRKKIHFAYNKAQIRPDSLQILEAAKSSPKPKFEEPYKWRRKHQKKK